MSDETPTPAPSFPELLCSAVVYRAAAKSSWVDRDNRCLTPEAYRLRPATDRFPEEEELSLGLASYCTAEAFTQQKNCGLNKVYAVATHLIGKIRDLGLTVTQDEPNHAALYGLYRLSEERDRAVRTKLSEQSRIVWPEQHKWPPPEEEK